ncbi:MAG: SUMF1/EgtB/PvdO family nonheme iron enzyme [Alphaproteobacteria bacterium]|nr:SUMF1/EgtB/PvdO family nonheme iron enzyme [Alphaproteobacteria bacterium]
MAEDPQAWQDALDHPLAQDLREELRGGRVVALVGSTVSQLLSGYAPATTWTGLLRDGLELMVALGRMDGEEATPFREILKGSHPDSLLLVAELVSRLLAGGEYTRWLRERLSNLTVDAPAIAEAIAALGVPVASAAYDTLLDTALERPALSWRQRSEAERWLRGEAPGVLHLLGCWNQPESVLLGVRDYAKAVEDPHAQAVLQSLRTTRTLLLIGCAEELRTPALSALWAWARERFAESEQRVYVLVQENQLQSMRASLQPEDRTVLVSYGSNPADLAPFLKGIAPRKPAPIDSSAADALTLSQYHLALRAEAEQLSRVFCPDGRRGLSDVYVRLRMRTSGLGDGPPPPAGPLRDYLRQDHRLWVVLGSPGSGKTSLLRRMTLELLEAGGPAPLLLKVSDICANRLWAATADRYGPEVAELLRARAAEGGLVVLLDGLDEAPDVPKARNQVGRIANSVARCCVVVSSRKADYDYLPGDFRELELLPLDESGQNELLSRYCADAGMVDRVLRMLRSRHRMRDLAETPLLLSLAGVLLREGRGIPEKRADLYDKALGLMLDPHSLDSERPRLRDVALARRALGVLSLALHDSKRDTYPLSAVRKALNGAVGDSVRQAWGSVERMLREVQRVTGLVEVDGERGAARQHLVFPHQTFREFFAAESLVWQMEEHGVLQRPAPRLETRAALTSEARIVHELPGDLPRILRGSRERPEAWSEVLALACGLLDGEAADRLVAWVASEGHGPLVARVVAEGEGMSRETVMTALGLEAGWEKWETRRDLLLDLPETVGDLSVVVGLLDTFAQGTTDGNDLFWVRELLRRIASGEVTGPAADETAADVRRRADVLAEDVLRRHRPEMRANLLRKLDAEELWRPIPPGWFKMGSRSSERGHWKAEAPQHRVDILTPFLMLAVPVTWEMYEAFDPGHQAARDPGNGPAEQQGRHPVNGVTWYAACAFAEWLEARLPLEAEWEYACRAGTTSRYWSGNAESDLAAVGWYESNASGRTHPVGTPPTPRGHRHPLGLHDMHGNVWELCLDAFSTNYRGRGAGVSVDPQGATMLLGGQDTVVAPPDLAAPRVVRGGSWSVTADYARSAFRYEGSPDTGSRNRGFRLVRPVISDP